MYSPVKHLETPKDFNFPFSPYTIQHQLMQSLYEVIEGKQIGIFESPTGTGKSLTLTCGALKWLLDHNELVKSELNGKIDLVNREALELEDAGAKSNDWIAAQFGSIQKKEELYTLKKIQSVIDDYDKAINELQERKIKEKEKFVVKSKTKDETFVVEKDTSGDYDDNLLVEDQDEDKKADKKDEDMENSYKDIKILFCSRTHSQLSQVLREIRRTTYGKIIRCISLASRQTMCINPSVKKLNNVALINERCLDMQKSQSKVTSSDSDGRTQKKCKTKQLTRCPYKMQNAVENLRDTTLVDILDIEELVSSGESVKACPYYSSRLAAKDAQVILLPYQMLLHRRTRLQTGIQLKNSIIIIDEAHNLLDTISSIYSTEVNLDQLKSGLGQMVSYKTKYFNRFSAKNLLKINQLIFVTKRLIKLLSPSRKDCRMIQTHDLMSEGEFFNINLYHLLEFCEETRFAQKVHGLAQKLESQPQETIKENEKTGATGLLKKIEEEQKMKDKKTKNKDLEPEADLKEIVKIRSITPSVIRPLLAFLESLMECADDGRVLLKYNEDPKNAGMKFILLNPGGHFEEIIKDSRAVIIAGGTMQPTLELTQQLFKSCPERVKQHFYGHVVPTESVQPFAVKKGPNGKNFHFNFGNRNNLEMLTELGMTLQNICNVVPAGIVCFFGSYDYLETVYQHLSKCGILSKIETKKHIFREPRTTAGGQSIEKMLADYARAVDEPSKNGAVIFSVVGGKLSEGLNFADSLGRCVIVVGMPYPNKTNPELLEKIKYLDETLGPGSGSEYYDNLCMKAVNQCIGRSIRHINDYACVLLLDERYTHERVKCKLPVWISNGLKVPDTFGMMQGAIAKFFRERRKS